MKNLSSPFSLLLCLSICLVFGMPYQTVQAQSATPPEVGAATDPALEKRVMALSEQLRCLVCQNQTIADSHATLAIDLRNQVREKLAKGSSDREVMDFMVQRYGDFVLYNPPVKTTTWLLWFGPFALFGLAFLLLLARLKKVRQQVEPSNAQLKTALELLETPNLHSTSTDKGKV